MNSDKSLDGVARFIDYLNSNGIKVTPIFFQATTHTAFDAAQELGCNPSQIVKSLIFVGLNTGQLVLVLVSGANKADAQRLAEILGEKVKLADKQAVLSVSGYPVGAVPPAGLHNISISIIDEDLGKYEQVWVSAGSDHAVVAISFDDLRRLSHGRVTTIKKTLAQPIIIEPYDPGWASRFTRERERIQGSTSLHLIGIEHIGSTAVPGLPAKPIIDILGGVNSLLEVPLFIPQLEKIGYVYIPEYEAQLPERRYLIRSEKGQVVVHLHIVEVGSLFWQEHLYFRDRLRADSSLRDMYGKLKIKLAEKYRNDRVGYTDAKTQFIHNVIHQG